MDSLIPVHIFEGVSGRDLARDAAVLSDKYRHRKKGDNPQLSSEGEALAYLAVRFPATFGAAHNVFSHLREILPDFRPASILDAGAGPGTVVMAARQSWPDLLATLLEPNRFLSGLGQQIIKDRAEWHPGTLQNYDPAPHDLVTAGYVLNETGFDAAVVEKLWRATGQVLVLIEPGTPQGYEIIVKARDFLIGQGAFIAAPCPHQLECPC